MRFLNLFFRALAYRIHNILIWTVILGFVTNRWKLAVGAGLIVNIINTLLYFHFHFWFQKLEDRFGKEN